MNDADYKKVFEVFQTLSASNLFCRYISSYSEFGMMLCLCRFIEYGEYKDNLYGTSLESIHRILDQNKVCLVDVQPEVSTAQSCQ